MLTKYHTITDTAIGLTDAALSLLAKGFSIIPVSVKTKRPMIPWKEFQTRHPTHDEVVRWFDGVDLSHIGIGIVTGAISGLTVVDFDTQESIESAKKMRLPVTPLVKTGRGLHAYFKFREGSRNFQKRDDLPGIDLRSEGGYVIAPPSMHKSGSQYCWQTGSSLDDLDLADLPEWLIASETAHKTESSVYMKGTIIGSRNDSLAKVAGTVVGKSYTLDEAIQFCRTWNQQNTPPLPDDEVIRTVNSIFETHTRNSQLSQLSQHDTEPLPLTRPLQANGPFPVDSLPLVMRAAVKRVHEVVQAPLDMICQSFLAAATLAVQPYSDVLIDGRRFPVSNNFVAVGESGERKSATDRIATGPIKERQRRDTELFLQSKKEFEATHAAWEKARKEAFRENDPDVMEAMLSRAGDEPKHVQPFYLFEEPSFEGLERAYAEGRYTLGLFSDEGGRFLGGYAMSKDNQTKTITGLSKLWDGEPIDRVRGGDGLSVLYGRRFSMNLMIQPILTGQLFGNSMLTGQGFLSRCLCCYPATNIGNRIYKADDLTTDQAISTYNTIINKLLDKELPLQEREDMGLKPACITLENDAKAAWIEFANQIELRQKEGGDLYPIKGFASKAAEHAARISGVLALFESPESTTINLQVLNGGIAILHYYIAEALRLFHAASDDQELLLAQKVFDWGMQQGGIVALADLYRLGPNAVRDKKTATKMMSILEEHNRAKRINGGAEVHGNHRRDVWKLHG